MTDLSGGVPDLKLWQQLVLAKVVICLFIIPFTWALLVLATIVFAATTPILLLASTASSVEGAAREAIKHLNQLRRKRR